MGNERLDGRGISRCGIDTNAECGCVEDALNTNRAVIGLLQSTLYVQPTRQIIGAVQEYKIKRSARSVVIRAWEWVSF